MAARLVFILGGARAGKSAYAQQLAYERGGEDVLYVATAEALDEEMEARIAAHRASRPRGWQTLESATLVGTPIVEEAAAVRVVLVDCLTLLASNALNAILAAGGDLTPTAGEAAVEAEIDAILSAVAATEATWIVVSNEVGLGLVPANILGRVYRDALGRANQRLAAAADEVIVVMAGLPLSVKGERD